MSEDNNKYNLNPMILNTGALNKLKTIKADSLGLLKLEPESMITDKESHTVFLTEGYFFTEADGIRTLKNKHTGLEQIISKIYKVVN